MKLMICGKGGSGKSTVAALLAKEMARQGFRVLLVDADESNIGLYRMLGLEMPATLMQDLGGKKGFQTRLKAQGQGLMGGTPIFPRAMDLDRLPKDCVAGNGGVRVVSTGKIEHFGEGCACPMGNLFRAFFEALNLGGQDLVLVDTAAGLEHFGRRLDGQCDHLICVVSPSFESLALARRMAAIAGEANLPVSLILNNLTPEIRSAMADQLPGLHILGEIPHCPEIFKATLNGEALEKGLPDLAPMGQALAKLAGGQAQ